MVNSSDQCWAEEGFLVEEIKNLLKVCSSSNVIFQPRECNIVAHGLAKSSLLEIENMYCIEHGPEWLMELIMVDSNSCNLSTV